MKPRYRVQWLEPAQIPGAVRWDDSIDLVLKSIVGWPICPQRLYIVVALSYEEGRYRDLVVVPRSTVIKMERLDDDGEIRSDHKRDLGDPDLDDPTVDDPRDSEGETVGLLPVLVGVPDPGGFGVELGSDLGS